MREFLRHITCHIKWKLLLPCACKWLIPGASYQRVFYWVRVLLFVEQISDLWHVRLLIGLEEGDSMQEKLKSFTESRSLKPTLRKFKKKLDKFFPAEIRFTIKMGLHSLALAPDNNQQYSFKSAVQAIPMGFSKILRIGAHSFLILHYFFFFFFFHSNKTPNKNEKNTSTYVQPNIFHSGK